MSKTNFKNLKLTFVGKSRFAHYNTNRPIAQVVFDIIDWDKEHDDVIVGISTEEILEDIKEIVPLKVFPKKNESTKYEFATLSNVYKVVNDDEVVYIGHFFSKWNTLKNLTISCKFDSINTIVKSVIVLIRK